MKNYQTGILVFIFIFIIICSFKNGGEASPTTKTFVSNDMLLIKSYIDIWGKYGYKVQSVVSQDVSISIGYIIREKQIKGDILLIMTK